MSFIYIQSLAVRCKFMELLNCCLGIFIKSDHTWLRFVEMYAENSALTECSVSEPSQNFLRRRPVVDTFSTVDSGHLRRCLVGWLPYLVVFSFVLLRRFGKLDLWVMLTIQQGLLCRFEAKTLFDAFNVLIDEYLDPGLTVCWTDNWGAALAKYQKQKEAKPEGSTVDLGMWQAVGMDRLSHVDEEHVVGIHLFVNAGPSSNSSTKSVGGKRYQNEFQKFSPILLLWCKKTFSCLSRIPSKSGPDCTEKWIWWHFCQLPRCIYSFVPGNDEVSPRTFVPWAERRRQLGQNGSEWTLHGHCKSGPLKFRMQT